MYYRKHQIQNFFRLFCALCCVAILFATTACDPEGPTDACASSSDCEQGQRCVQKKCKEIVIINENPVARASGPRNAKIKSSVELDGSKSSDPEGSDLIFAWKISKSPSGSNAELQDATKETATLIPDLGGEYSIELIVEDDKGQKSIPVNVIIDVQGSDQNSPPNADAGTDTFGGVGGKLTLDGTRSNDPDGDALTYKWSISSKPSDSSAKLDDETKDKPEVTFDKQGKYIFALVVSDGIADSTPDSVTIEILGDFDLEPSTTKLSPDSGALGTTPEVTITGDGFSTRAVVLFNGTSVPGESVTVKSKTEILVKLKLTGLSAKKYPLIVRNPNQKESAPLEFSVLDLPAPTLASMSPTAGAAGSKIKLILTGTGFVSSSDVLFNLLPLSTTYKNETTLEAELDLTKTPSGDYKVKVQNPGGKSSQELTFKVNDTGGFSPVLQVLNPSQGTVNTNITFSVHGSSFDPGAVIIFDGKEIASIRQSRDTIESDPSLDLTKYAVGKYDVWVRNPNGKESVKEVFEVIEKDPAPKLDRILPPTIYLNDVTTIDVYGNFFVPGVKLFLGTKEYSGTAIQSLSKTYFTVSVDTTTGTWSAGNLQAYVINPNAKKSNSFTLTLATKPTVPPPVLRRLSPTSGESGKTITSFYIYGDKLCAASSTCTSLPRVLILDASKKDWQASNTILTSITSNLGSSSPHIRGKLDLTGVPAGSYKVQVEHGTSKVLSNQLNFTVRPAPGINIDRLSPTSGLVGVNIPDFRIYGDSFCSGTTSCTTPPKIYIKNSAGTDIQATLSVFKISSTSLSSNSSYIRGALEVTKMPKGSYTFQIEHPVTAKKSGLKSFSVSTPQPLSLNYITPYYAKSGSIVECRVNGGPFTSSSYVMVGNDKVNLKSGTSKTARTFDFDVKIKYVTTGNYDIRVCNSPTVCSNIFPFPVQPPTGTEPFLTAVRGQTYPMLTNATIDLSIYGYRWLDATTAKFTLDGKELNNTNFTYNSRVCKSASSATSSSNCLFKGFKTTPLAAGKHTMVVSWPTKTSISYDFYVQAP